MQSVPLFACVAITLCISSAVADEARGIADIRELNEAIAKARPGTTIRVADGTYQDWAVKCATSGTVEMPITITAASPGGVTFTGPATRFHVTGSFVTIRGFRFDSVVRGDTKSIVELQGPHARVSECAFKSCGHRVGKTWKRYARIVGVSFNPETNLGAHHSRIDRNYFYDSQSVSCGIVLGYNDFAPERWPAHSVFEHNWFYKLPRLDDNGQEAIQLTSGGDGTGQFAADGHDTGHFRMFATVQSNLFYKADADPEICSVKCSDNIIRYNTFLANTRGGSGLTIRGGSRNKVIGNYMIDSYNGLRVYGHDHVIVNNYIQATNMGIGLHGVQRGGQTASGSLFAFNTIANGKAGFGVRLDMGSTAPSPGNTWINNILQCYASNHSPIDNPFNAATSTWKNNLLWNRTPKPLGFAPPGSQWADPQLVPVAGSLLARPATASPALDAGVDLRGEPWAITEDLDGDTRATTTPEIGCDEISDKAPTRRPLRAVDVGPTWLGGKPWGDPEPDAGL